MLYTKFDQNWHSGSWEEVENVKFTDGQTDSELKNNKYEGIYKSPYYLKRSS